MCLAQGHITVWQVRLEQYMSDVFDTQAESKAEIFSMLNLCSGFWQVGLDNSTKMISGFITHSGVYYSTD